MRACNFRSKVPKTSFKKVYQKWKKQGWRMSTCTVWSMIVHAQRVLCMQYVLYYIGQVISGCLPLRTWSPPGWGPCLVKAAWTRRGLSLKVIKEADLLARWKKKNVDQIPKSKLSFHVEAAFNEAFNSTNPWLWSTRIQARVSSICTKRSPHDQRAVRSPKHTA